MSGPNPITMVDIEAYLRVHSIRDNQYKKLFLHLIDVLDGEYLVKTAVTTGEKKETKNGRQSSSRHRS